MIVFVRREDEVWGRKDDGLRGDRDDGLLEWERGDGGEQQGAPLYHRVTRASGSIQFMYVPRGPP
jgi:hypothetical protein